MTKGPVRLFRVSSPALTQWKANGMRSNLRKKMSYLNNRLFEKGQALGNDKSEKREHWFYYRT